ncbi:MAG: PP2C family protein-serine/threonine phosphatase [Bacteroidetes bacterium]|nr:PP2C family protein-serine/threonine phosphatase [Bacteroidota bacterium]
MDSLLDVDKYLTLPKEKSYRLSLDTANMKMLRGMMIGVAIFFSISFFVTLADNGITIGAGILLTDLVILVGGLILYRKIFNINNVNKFVQYFFILHVVVLIGIGISNGNVTNNKKVKTKKSKTTSEQTATDTSRKVENDSSSSRNIRIGTTEGNSNSDISPFIFFFCVALVVFRLTRAEIFRLSAIFFLPPILVDIFILGNDYAGNYIGTSVTVALFVGLAIFIEYRRKNKFFKEYDVMYKKNYDNIRMKKELEYAQALQLSMLPEKSAVINDVEISAISIPATEVGGDYYDYFKLSEEKIGVFICDVSGHGVASALLLSGIRSCMHLILEETDDPKVIFTKLNRVIRKTQNRKMFVTAIFAVIDLKENRCTLYNAGHLPPYKISGETNEIYKLKKHGLTLGAADNIYADESKEVVIDFKRRDKLILYTDGVNEAQNEKRDEYGIDKIEEFLNSNSDKSTTHIIDELVADVNKFTQNKIQSDDLTIIAIERKN